MNMKYALCAVALAALATPAVALGVLVRTLPSVIVAGLIALSGVWVLNNVDLSSLRLPSFLQTSSVEGPTDRATVDRDRR
jgi:hypothetical protein